MSVFLCVLSVFFPLGEAWAESLQLKPGATESILYDSRRDACDSSDLPDAPARAFRNEAGVIVLFVPNFKARAFEGASLAALSKDCRIRFAAGGKADPDLLDDRSWLHAFLTLPDRRVLALASASYLPYRHDLACAAGKSRTSCWYNGIAAAISDDDGHSFAYVGKPPSHLILPPPEPYDDDTRSPASFVTATNIVRWKDYAYSLVWFRGERAGDRRNCLIRAPLSDPFTWSILTEDGFVEAARFENGRWDTEPFSCGEIGDGVLENVRSLVFHKATGTFIAVYSRSIGRAEGEGGFYYSTSRDLLEWSKGRLLYEGVGPIRANLNDPGHVSASIAYPSLIDETSTDPDFGTVSDNFDLILVRIAKDSTGPRVRPYRQIVRVPVVFSAGG